jgi:hypothetical protein
VFNQPVTQDSVESDLHFADQPRVTATPDPYDREVFHALPLPGGPGALAAPNAPALVIPGGTPAVTGEARRIWLVSPPTELPLNTRSRLTFAPGLRSHAGPLPELERRTIVAFDTFPEFRFLGVRCLVGNSNDIPRRRPPLEGGGCCRRTSRAQFTSPLGGFRWRDVCQGSGRKPHAAARPGMRRRCSPLRF